jgi:trimethylamine--corrinoid protein Co-methyltransferase
MGNRRTGNRRATRLQEAQTLSPLADKPFRRLQNRFQPLEPLSVDELEQLHNASMRIVEEIGIDFLDREALELWQSAGARVNFQDQHVWIDRDLLLSLVRQAPARFNLRARDESHSLAIGGNHINFATVGGAPFYSDLDRGRRPGSLEAFRRMVRLTQQCGPLHVVEGLLLEPQDVPVPWRHLDKAYSQLTLSDKVYTAAAHGREIANDYLQMAALVFGGIDRIENEPVFASVVNANSPLRFDERMLGGLITYARHGQSVIVTPFVLAGAMSPVTLAAAIAQQNAEALAGVALAQIVRPGVPVIYGGFTTNIDMRTGSPAFGTPEGALALLCGAQLARHYGLPYRGSGGLNNSKLPDAQASYETQMSLWPAVMAHANIILHSAGWLEAGLVCSLEKFIIDVEGLAVMQRIMDGLEISDDTLALDMIAAVGPGGHHFGTPHTLARYRSEHYQPVVSDRQGFQNWQDNGALDAAQRANAIAKQLLAVYEPPPMDIGVAEALNEYVARRREELAKTHHP